MKNLFTITFVCAFGLLVNSATAQIWGENNSRTERRDNAGSQGSEGAMSGFYDTPNPINFPAGASSWWHLLDVRHVNAGNNYAMQFSGSFYDQDLWFRKTNGNGSQSWSKVLLERNGKVGIGVANPEATLEIVDVNNQNPSIFLKGNSNTYKDFRTINSSNGKMWEWSHRVTSEGEDFEAHHFNGSSWLRVLSMTPDGAVGIGTNNTHGYKFAVAGDMIAESVRVQLQSLWPDYVFMDSYKLPSLEHTERFINENKHLPEIPSAEEIKEKGIDLGAVNAALLKKIEELTLHLIEQNKQLAKQNERLDSQQLQIDSLLENRK